MLWSHATGMQAARQRWISAVMAIAFGQPGFFQPVSSDLVFIRQARQLLLDIGAQSDAGATGRLRSHQHRKGDAAEPKSSFKQSLAVRQLTLPDQLAPGETTQLEIG
jgi:hypothetical protein